MSPAEILARLRDPAALANATPTKSDLIDATGLDESRLRHAAVLVPIVTHADAPTQSTSRDENESE